MLLRRVTHHIQSQNWFAVFVDFVIVVVGVFVGLQVQDWNDARKDRIQEQKLLARLDMESRALLAAQNDELNKLRRRGELLMGINPVLFGQEPARPLTTEECMGISRSHAYRRPPDELPVLDEMLETGRFDLLTNPLVTEHLRGYVLLRERARAHYSEVVNELFRLHSRFPALIEIRREAVDPEDDRRWGGLSGAGYQWLTVCDINQMRASVGFRNEYVDNLSRINSLTGYLAERIDHLTRLQELLDGDRGASRTD